jgi:type II secretory pathway pseudopilin PulG
MSSMSTCRGATSTSAFRKGGMCGTSLLEILFTLTVVSIAAGAAGSAIGGLSSATSVETARLRTLATLMNARRRAYTDEATVQVDVAAGSDALTVRNPDGTQVRIALPAGTIVTDSAATGRVRFFASSLAENATITLANTAGTQQAGIVVTQRGLIR